ncbi:MAG TPA: hypothetical protein VFW23_02565 [Tepidisphaeraceae bacterium]|nr:hypothetical protein [Tepidisphaeraceae bacterium]
MKIVTPQRNETIEVAQSRLAQYLAEGGLVAVRSGIRDTMVAFPAIASDMVQMALNGEMPRVEYRGVKQLSRDITESLNHAPIVALVAGKDLIREFFSTEGFCKTMKAATSETTGVELAVPPGAYEDGKHLAVWRRTPDVRVKASTTL